MPAAYAVDAPPIRNECMFKFMLGKHSCIIEEKFSLVR